jgi:serine/threonine protein kinase
VPNPPSPSPFFPPVTGAGLTQQGTDTAMLIPIVVAAVVFVVVVGIAAFGCCMYNRKLRRRLRNRAKTGIGANGGMPMEPGMVSKDSMELGSSTTKQTWKFSMSDLDRKEEIGAGAFGTVYRSMLKGTEVALKVPVGDGNKLRAIIDSFVDEFELMMSLRHPNVLLTMGIAMADDDGVPGIVMEHMQASLLDVITLPFFKMVNKWDSALLSITSDVSKGMSYLHHLHDLLHRDLKPANILLDEHWTAKIADFGTALSELKEDVGEDDLALQGTPPYMAPEIVEKQEYTQAGDVWAFGCVLVHMGSGHTPYSHLKLTHAKELFEIIKTRANSPLETMSLAKNVPAAVTDLATACLAPETADRPNFEEIVKRVDALVGDKHPRPLSRLARDVMQKAPGSAGSSAPTGEMMKTYNVFKTFDSKAAPITKPEAIVLEEAAPQTYEEEPKSDVTETMKMSGFFESMGKSFRQSFDAGVAALSPKEQEAANEAEQPRQVV